MDHDFIHLRAFSHATVPRRLPAIASNTISSASHVTMSFRRNDVSFVGIRSHMSRMLLTTSAFWAVLGMKMFDALYDVTTIGSRIGHILCMVSTYIYARLQTATPLFHVCLVYCFPLCSNSVSPLYSASAFAALNAANAGGTDFEGEARNLPFLEDRLLRLIRRMDVMRRGRVMFVLVVCPFFLFMRLYCHVINIGV